MQYKKKIFFEIIQSLEAYIVVNFRARGISRGTHKLARTPTLNKNKKKPFQLG
jgi:hypothetical protein